MVLDAQTSLYVGSRGLVHGGQPVKGLIVNKRQETFRFRREMKERKSRGALEESLQNRRSNQVER